jgi:DNA-binding response OmpR family regulator
MGNEQFGLYIIDEEYVSAGLMLCKKIRETDSETPIVIFTDLADMLRLVVGEQAGVYAYVPKPNVGELLTTVVELLKAKKDSWI